MNNYVENYKLNQYEGYNNGVFPYSVQINAKYIEQEIEEYRNNPLIEALPPIYSMEQVFIELERPPLFTLNDPKGKNINRIHKIRRLDNYLYPIPKHFEIECIFSSVLRAGYTDRNIATDNFIKIHDLYSPLLNDKWKDRIKEEITTVTNVIHTSTPGFVFIGISGAGKTTAVSNVLSLYPQVIVHMEYKEHKFLLYQLVWIRIDCTYTGELGDLCKEFFLQVDKAIGTNYSVKYSGRNKNVEDMFRSIAGIVERHRLGALIIDEIQNLASAKVGIEKVTNFLVRIENELKLPIIYIGTYKAFEKVLGASFRETRRACGAKEIIWNRMSEQEDWEEWGMFIENMWKYQFTEKQCILTNEIKKILYDKSVGIIDRVLKLFMASQLQAIITGVEELSAELVTEVADKYMPISKKMIDAIKNIGKPGEKVIDDIIPPNIEWLFANAEDSAKTKDEIKQRLINLSEDKEFKTKIKKKDIILNIVSAVCALHEIENAEAYSIVHSIVEKYGVNKDYNFLLRATGKELLKVKHQKKSISIDKPTEETKQGKKLAKDKSELGEKNDMKFEMNDKIKDFKDLL